MPPKASVTLTPTKQKSSILINSHAMQNVSAVEITPGGNGFYAVTVRQTLTDQLPDMFKETYKGKLHIVYSHPCLETVRLQGTFLDFGIQDEDGKCVLSLFFKAAQDDTSPLMELSKSSIALV